MKYSDYLNVEPSPKKINSAVNIRDEHRETILEHKIASLTAELTNFKDQSAELAEVKGHNTNLLINQREKTEELNNLQSTLRATESQVENESKLKQEIKYNKKLEKACSSSGDSIKQLNNEKNRNLYK